MGFLLLVAFGGKILMPLHRILTLLNPLRKRLAAGFLALTGKKVRVSAAYIPIVP
jgi:hypothetical protein